MQEAAHEDANIIFGAVIDPAMDGEVKITVIATEFEPEAEAGTEGTALAAASSSAPTPNDLNAYVARQDQDVAEAAHGAAVADGRSSEVVGRSREAEAESKADRHEAASELLERVVGDDISDRPTAASLEESAADQAIAKARALSNLSIARRPTIELPIAPDPAAEVDIDASDEGTEDIVDRLPAFLRSAD